MKSGKKPHLVKNVSEPSLKDIENAFGVVTLEDGNLLSAEDFKGFQDFHESLKELHKGYRIEINWDNFNELQIQVLIAILYHSIGYFPENFHGTDPAREDGADLEFKRQVVEELMSAESDPAQLYQRHNTASSLFYRGEAHYQENS